MELLIFLSNFLATGCFGNLIAIVFLPAVVFNLEILDLGFFLSIKVIGPGQKAL